jgi:outer membrane protein
MNNKITLALLAAGLVTASFANVAQAHQAGDIIVRAGIATVAPNESSPVVAGEDEFTVGTDTQLGLNFAYMVTDNIGVELLAASPFSHDISLGSLGKIAETKHLPPTLVAQYYFGQANSVIRPYIGLGLNYTNFYDNEFTNDLNGALTNLSMTSSWGVAGQIGVDYKVNKDWLVNASVWYAKIQTDVTFDMGGVAQNVETDIDPWVYMVSVGYSF